MNLSDCFSLWKRSKSGFYSWCYVFTEADFKGYQINTGRFTHGWCIVRMSDGVIIAESK